MQRHVPLPYVRCVCVWASIICNRVFSLSLSHSIPRSRATHFPKAQTRVKRVAFVGRSSFMTSFEHMGVASRVSRTKRFPKAQTRAFSAHCFFSFCPDLPPKTHSVHTHKGWAIAKRTSVALDHGRLALPCRTHVSTEWWRRLCHVSLLLLPSWPRAISHTPAHTHTHHHHTHHHPHPPPHRPPPPPHPHPTPTPQRGF
jgi:hypothetical protein